MKVNVAIEVTEDTRRRLRAFYGRGGMATRNEYRVWLNGLISKGLDALPEPKRRRPKPGPDPDFALSRYAVADACGADVLCRHCNKPKADHGLMGYSCPLTRSTAVRKSFEPVEAAL